MVRLKQSQNMTHFFSRIRHTRRQLASEATQNKHFNLTTTRNHAARRKRKSLQKEIPLHNGCTETGNTGTKTLLQVWQHWKNNALSTRWSDERRGNMSRQCHEGFSIFLDQKWRHYCRSIQINFIFLSGNVLKRV